MLDLFRKQKQASKWILAVITGIMALGMVVFFIPTGTTTEGDLTSSADVAKVGKDGISGDEFSTALKNFLKNSKYPKDYDFLKQVGVPKELLDQMITQKLVIQEAHRLGLEATDQEVRDKILAYPVFQQMGGSFNMQIYQRILQQAGTTVDEFEQNERDQILTDKLKHLVTDGIVVTPEAAEASYRNANEKVTLQYVLFNPTEIEKTMKVNDAELQKYFDANKQEFMTTEQRKVRYILVDMNKVRDNTKLTDQDLRQYYDQNRIKYFVGDRVRVSHILFSTQGKTPEEIAQIHQKALEVLSKIRAGANFAQMAKEYSDDASSKNKGGDLGWVDENTPFVPEFKDVALSLGVGAVSDLVKSPFGYHIITVTAKEPAHTMSFEEAKAQIQPVLLAQKAFQEGQDEANKIFAAVSPKPQDLEAVANQFGAEVRETPVFGQGDSVPDIGSNPDFEKAVFSTPLNKVGGPVQVAPGFVVPEVVQIVPPHVPTLAEVKDRVEAAYKQDAASALAKQKADAFSKSVAKAKDFEAAAKAAGLKPDTTSPFARNASVPGIGSSIDISKQAFNMKVGETSTPVKQGTIYVVFRVKDRTEVTATDFEKVKTAAMNQLLNQKRDEAFQSFQDDLMARAEKDGRVRINQSALDAVVNRVFR